MKPRDQIEAMLLTQMAGVYMATTRFTQRLAGAENIPQQDFAERALNRLARTFVAQTEAFKRYRSGGEQNVTVQNVSVRAILGNVTQAPRESAADKAAADRPHSPTHSTSDMKIVGEQAPTAVPSDRKSRK
jgi:hypothetical protein